MSFGGFGGFGSNNNQQQQQQPQQNTGFGGFGSNNNTTGGFGASTTNTGFGSNTANTGTSLFGGNNNTSTGGFGSGGGFGTTNTTNSSPFGAAKPGFGGTNTTGGSLFGGSTATTGNAGGFGGFGSSTNNAPATTGFGSGTTGGGLFGSTQNKPAFGSGGNTGGSLFGGGNTTTGSFGSTTNNTGGFGATPTSFGGGGQQAAQNQGTSVTPFAAHVEKDATSSTNSHYQSITFQQPYSNYSFEELRVADYNAGRRYGNSNGQAGAFGTSTGFGGFGQTSGTTTGGFGATTTNTGGGLFGSQPQSQSQSPFGQNQQTNTTVGFGSGTTGGMFGAAKPATGGLFGAAAPATSAQTGGGMFGTSGNTTGAGGFGGFGSSTTGTTGGLFGGAQNQNQTQNKPAFGAFGTGTGTTGGFGSSTGGFGQSQQQQQPATGGAGLFGSTTTGNTNPFGSTQQQPSTGGTNLFGGFGQNQNQNQTNTQTGTTGGLFGGFGQNQSQQQQKPGLFGASTTGTTGGSLFGGNNQQQQQPAASGGLFGGNQNNQQSGGLFGAKPATGGTGLFGGGVQSNTGNAGGLFGSQPQNQTQGSNMFGQNPQNQQKPGLFGGSTNNTGGGSLFGGLGQSSNQNPFGGSQQQQLQGGSLFGGSQQNQQQPQQPSLNASLMQNPYGNDQLFANLGTPSPSIGPLATPLSGAQKPAKRPQMLPAFKINPSASMRLITPQKRPSNGYGFAYSSYGTPGSAQSFSSGRASLLGSGGLGRPLSKSLSTSNLRSPLSAEDSVLAPGAFTPNPRPYSSGNSIRKLKIDRTLRTDLFGSDASGETPGRPNKRVSFDSAGTNGVTRQANGDADNNSSNAVVRTETDGPEPTAEELGLLRASRQTPKDTKTNGSVSRPEMEQVRGNELAIVPEDEQVPTTEPRPSIRKGLNKSQTDQEPGEYYMIPSMQDVRDMSRDQLKRVSPFVVGRVGIGKIEFDQVDLTGVPLEQIMGDIVKLNVRSATVYETGVNTPPEGKGLNVPSTITLENSWPRSNAGRLPIHERKGPRYDKHIERLRRVGGTEFLSYNPETGEWLFRVQHFTTYELDDDEDETMMETSGVRASADTPTPKATTPIAPSSELSRLSEEDASMMSPEQSDPDDTFDFKKGPRKTIPGGFNDLSMYEDEDMNEGVTPGNAAGTAPSPESPTQARTARNNQASTMEDPFEEDLETSQALMSPPETDNEQDHDMVGAFPQSNVEINNFGASFMPKSILKSNARAETPPKDSLDLVDDWAKQLQRTMSPKKQDRQILRERQTALSNETAAALSGSVYKASANGGAFNTTMDIMNSLWAQPNRASTSAAPVAVGGKGFEWPYAKQSQSATESMTDTEQAFHSSVKPSWTNDGILVYAVAGSAAALQNGTVVNMKKSIVSEGKDVRFAKIASSEDTKTPALDLQFSKAQIKSGQGNVPVAQTSSDITFASLSQSVTGNSPQQAHERQVWKLASILFDPLELACAELTQGVPPEDVAGLEQRIRRDAVLSFWKSIVNESVKSHVKDASTAEEKALAYLSGGDIESACIALVEGRDFRLATVIAQLPAGSKAKEIMTKQINSWRSQNVLSEFPLAIRALYELAAGNVCSSEGKTGPPEDRAPTFGIAQQFRLEWQRAFGLRLWYSTEDLSTAIRQYASDIADGKETVRPVPYFAQQKLPPSWDDPALVNREDTLFALLRLYANHVSKNASGQPALRVTDLLTPAAVSGNPLNARLSWQLSTTLLAQGVLSARQLPATLLDDLTLSFAMQLEGAKLDPEAFCSILHLSTPSARQRYIPDLLSRSAQVLDSEVLFATLVNDLHVPESWLHEARALYASSAHDFEAQVSHLLKAGDPNAAHTVLCRTVAPKAIIELDYDILRELLGDFLNDKGAAPTSVEGWRTGGQVYFDYIHLLDLEGHEDEDSRREKTVIIKRLGTALPGMLAAAGGESNKAGKAGLEERVAVGEMASHVARIARAEKEDKILDDKRLARLPVHDDSYVKQGVRLAGLYYRAINVQ